MEIITHFFNKGKVVKSDIKKCINILQIIKIEKVCINKLLYYQLFLSDGDNNNLISPFTYKKIKKTFEEKNI